MKNILIVLIVILGALGILTISMSRASLEVMKRDENEGRLRVNPVFVENKMVYKLPQTNILPNNVFYPFKEVRDWLWFKFSVGKEREAKTMLVLADKRISEAKSLAEKGNYKKAFETGMKAVDKLKYSKELVLEIKNQNIVQEQMLLQIRDASLAYSEIIKEIGQSAGGNNQKYLLLQQNIDDFKEKQIQKEKAN